MTRLRLILCLTLVACSDVTAPGIPATDPLITGSITGPSGFQNALLVVASPGDDCRLSSRLQIVVDGDTPVVRRSGAAADHADLRAGMVVSVWTDGPILESCPAVVFPSIVVIESP